MSLALAEDRMSVDHSEVEKGPVVRPDWPEELPLPAELMRGRLTEVSQVVVVKMKEPKRKRTRVQ